MALLQTLNEPSELATINNTGWYSVRTYYSAQKLQLITEIVSHLDAL